jgi:hypothetical protein
VGNERGEEKDGAMSATIVHDRTELSTIRFKALLRQIRPPFGWSIHLGQDQSRLFVQVRQSNGKCNVTGIDGFEWNGRKWLVTQHMTDSEFVQTVFKACLTAVEHEVREQFLYQDVSVFDPHYDLDRLVELRKSEGALSVRA